MAKTEQLKKKARGQISEWTGFLDHKKVTVKQITTSYGLQDSMSECTARSSLKHRV